MKQGRKIVCGSQSGVLSLYSWGAWNDCSDRFPGHPASVDALVRLDEDTVVTGSSDGLIRIVGILPNKMLGIVGEHAEYPIERLGEGPFVTLLPFGGLTFLFILASGSCPTVSVQYTCNCCAAFDEGGSGHLRGDCIKSPHSNEGN